MPFTLKKCFPVLLLCLLLATSLNAKLYIATRDMKVRADKNMHAKVIGQVKKRATVEVTGIDDVWWKIAYNDQDGYVQGKYLKEAPENIPAPEQTETATDSGLPGGISLTQAAILIGAILAIIVIIRQIRKYILRKRAEAAYRPPEIKEVRITFWYQCRHCRASIKKDTEPNIAGCSQSVRHAWIKLGELGDDKYICKNCSTIINVKGEPTFEGCPGGDGVHIWKKL